MRSVIFGAGLVIDKIRLAALGRNCSSCLLACSLSLLFDLTGVTSNSVTTTQGSRNAEIEMTSLTKKQQRELVSERECVSSIHASSRIHRLHAEV